MPNDIEIFLLENDVGFSHYGLGFPSLDACRGVVYQNTHGIFGYHKASGYREEDSYPGGNSIYSLAKRFADFVHQHPNGAGHPLALYVAAKLKGGTYGTEARKKHLSEMKAFAQALKISGSFKSYDLSMQWGIGSVYVEVVRRHPICEMYGVRWPINDNGNQGPPIAKHMRDHRTILLRPPNAFPPPKRVYSSVNVGNLQKLNTQAISV